MTTLPEFQIPKISSEDVDDNRGTFTIEPLDKGFGYTFGNSLRRVLLSSLGGAAIKSVRIEGVAHEFSTVSGVKEDVTDIVLNLKDIVIRMHTDADEVEAPLVATGPGEVKAKDIDLPAGVEILNPDAPIATLEKRTKLEMYLTIGRGRGYSPAEENKTEDQPIGVIPIDSIFSPIRRASYAVDSARVGQRTDFDKLTLEVETDGSIEPGSALREAAEILIKSLAIFTDADRVEELTSRDGAGAAEAGASRRVAAGRGRRPPDRGARDRRPRLQLPEARRHPDGRRPRPALGVGAERDPELRQALDRRGHGGAARARPHAARRVAGAGVGRRRDAPRGRQRHKLSRDAAHRRALLRNLCREVIEHERIKTSQAKAKAVKPEVEKLITLGQARRPARPPPGALRARPGQVPGPQAVRGDRARATRSAPAATRGSSSSARAARTRPRWSSSSWSRPRRADVRLDDRLRRVAGSPAGRRSPGCARSRASSRRRSSGSSASSVELTVAGRTDAGVHAWARWRASSSSASCPTALAERLNAVLPARRRGARGRGRRPTASTPAATPARAPTATGCSPRRCATRSRRAGRCGGRYPRRPRRCSTRAPPRSSARTTSPPSRRPRPSTCCFERDVDRAASGGRRARRAVLGDARVLDRGRRRSCATWSGCWSGRCSRSAAAGARSTTSRRCSRARRASGPGETAPPHGLYLASVRY